MTGPLPAREEERQLVKRAKSDPNAFGELYDRHVQQIYRFVYSRLREQPAAEDVTSEVFVRALRSLGRYQDTGRPFSAWLYQIAVNLVNDRYLAARPTQDIDQAYGLAADEPGLDEVTARRHLLRRIAAVIDVLPPAQRTAMVLKFQEDLKIDDIASVMGKTPGAVKLLIHRGVTRVRSEIPAPEAVE